MHLRLNRSGRTWPLLLGLLVIGAIFIVRLFWLQIVQHNYYEQQANAEHISKFTLLASRGTIYARDGDQLAPLVLNQPVYLVYADPAEVENKQAIIDAVRQVAGGNAVKNFEKGLDDQSLRYTVLAKGLSKTQAELLQKKKLAGVGFQQGEQRVYPEGSMAAQLLGFVDGEGRGQYGIEGALDDRLKGKNGELKAVTDVRQIPLTVSGDYVNQPAQNGDDLVLNIDQNIQAYVEGALQRGIAGAKATKGSIIVMDPQNGHVLAMANLPSYDPGKYNQVSDYRLFQNNVVSEPYEVGSVFKTLTIGTGLDTNAITPVSTFNNTGKIDVDGITIRNVEDDPINAHASVTDILRYSLNTGVVWTEKQMGGGEINAVARQKIYDYDANHYQFGKVTGIEQANEQPGILRGPNEGSGLNVRYANMAFGQGLNVTTLQMAAAFSAAINGGTYYQPQLINGVRQADGTVKTGTPHVVKDGVLRPEISTELRNLIVTSRQLGALGGHDKPGFVVGGKTGTVQVIDPRTGTYTNENSLGTYVGFGGGKTPRYVIMVKVDDPHIHGYAGTTAAGPIFGDVSNWLLGYLKVQPNQ